MPRDEVRFGLIGYGAWGCCHAAAIATTPGARLAAVVDRSAAARAAAQATFPDADVVEDYQQLLDREELDVIDIVLPNHLHHEVASAALRSGKHVFLEKPMCLSAEHCDDLIHLAKQDNRRLAIAHQFRLSSLWGKVKDMVDGGLVGEPQYVLLELSRNPYRPGADGWRLDIAQVGDWILEEPIHFFDLARWYLESAGRPQTVYAAANSRQPGHPELQDNFVAVVRFAGGAYAVVSQTLAAFEHHQTAKIAGTKGALWASWSGAMDRTRHPTFFLKAFDGQKLEHVRIERAAGELFELEDYIAVLVRAIRDGCPLPCRGEDGMWSVSMCLSAARSVKCGEVVSI